MPTAREQVGRAIRRSEQAVRVYLVEDAASETAAQSYVEGLVGSTLPSTVDGLPFAGVEEVVEVVPDDTYEVRAVWSVRDQDYEQQAPGDVEWTVSAAPQTVRIFYATATTAYGSAGFTSPPTFDNAINVTPQGIAGVDVQTARTIYTRRSWHTATGVTADYLDYLDERVGSINSTSFSTGAGSGLTIAVGEGKFTGYTYNVRRDGVAEITLTIERIRNQEDLTIPNITGTIDKKGWQYLWVLTVGVADTTRPDLVHQRPIAAYVQDVLPSMSWSSLTNTGL